MKSRNVVLSMFMAQLVLLIPLIAMQFSDEWDWGLADFVVVGILLAGVGVAYQMIIVGLKSNPRQLILGLVIAAAMLLLWVELAVGIFGTPFAGS